MMQLTINNKTSWLRRNVTLIIRKTQIEVDLVSTAIKVTPVDDSSTLNRAYLITTTLSATINRKLNNYSTTATYLFSPWLGPAELILSDSFTESGYKNAVNKHGE